MRPIGHLNREEDAKALGDYLLVQGIQNEVEPEEGGTWTLWIHDDDQVEQAQSILADFQKDPSSSRFRSVGRAARELRTQAKEEEKKWQKRFHDRRSVWRGGRFRLRGLTSALVAVSVAVFLAQMLLGDDARWLRLFRIADYSEIDGRFFYQPGLREVRAGQIWRLITPIFLHFGILHILFNMMWLLDLGGQIENRLGTRHLALLVGIIAIISNVAQYLTGGPGFGGMSGVVFGLFGYIWVRSKLDFNSGLHIEQMSVILMLFWFFICMTGLAGPIANMAHAAGLGVGLLAGFIAAKLA